MQRLLKEDLGNYKNGIPSIWIFGSSSNPPSASDGLECLVKAWPGGKPAGRSSGGQKIKEQLWEVTLKNFQESPNLRNALRKIEKRFIVKELTHLPSTVDTYEQARLTIYDCIAINI